MAKFIDKDGLQTLTNLIKATIETSNEDAKNYTYSKDTIDSKVNDAMLSGGTTTVSAYTYSKEYIDSNIAPKTDDITITKDPSTLELSVKDNAITTSKIANHNVTYEKLDEALYNDIIKLLNRIFPLEISLSFSPSSLQEKGTIATVSMSWEAKIDGTTVPITSAILNNMEQTSNTFNENITDTQTYTLSVEAERRSASTSRTVTFVSPIYVGFDSHTEYVEGLEYNLSKQGLRVSLETLTVNTTNDSAEKYFWILSPYVVNHIKTSSFEIIDDFIYEMITINNTFYHTYRLNKPSTVGSFTFELS